MRPFDLTRKGENLLGQIVRSVRREPEAHEDFDVCRHPLCVRYRGEEVEAEYLDRMGRRKLRAWLFWCALASALAMFLLAGCAPVPEARAEAREEIIQRERRLWTVQATCDEQTGVMVYATSNGVAAVKDACPKAAALERGRADDAQKRGREMRPTDATFREWATRSFDELPITALEGAAPIPAILVRFPDDWGPEHTRVAIGFAEYAVAQVKRLLRSAVEEYFPDLVGR